MSSAAQPEKFLVDSSYLEEIEIVIHRLDSDIHKGLSNAQAEIRLRRDGANELRIQPVKPAWHHLLAQFQDPLVYLLLVAVAITLGTWLLVDGREWPVDAVVISMIVLAK
ncbi:cation-transporting P-type ATPase [Pseudomonas neuropathica]